MTYWDKEFRALVAAAREAEQAAKAALSDDNTTAQAATALCVKRDMAYEQLGRRIAGLIEDDEMIVSIDMKPQEKIS